MAKEVRGGKYVPVPKSERKRRRSIKEEPIDVEMLSVIEKGKRYFYLSYVGGDKKVSPKWRQTYSPVKYAKKHKLVYIFKW